MRKQIGERGEEPSWNFRNDGIREKGRKESPIEGKEEQLCKLKRG